MHTPNRSRSRCLVLWVLAFCFLNSGMDAQEARLELKAAKKHSKEKNFKQASINFKAAWDVIANDHDLLFQAGYCHFEANQLSEAQRCFEKLRENQASYHDLQWMLARTYQAQHRFKEAIKAYKQALKEIGKNDERYAWIRNELLRCRSGSQYMRRQAVAWVEPFGKEINSEQDEFAAFPATHFDGKYYFSARWGHTPHTLTNVSIEKNQNQADLYWTRQVNGIWQPPEKLHSEINSNLDEEILDFGRDGQVMFFSRGLSEDRYEIYTDTFHLEAASIHYERFRYPVIAEIGDRAMSIFQDTMMILSSARTGGYGAYDLYISVWRNGSWTEPVNLGPEINGPFNEDFPFLAKDGQTLFFSSDRLESMGAYDIFQTKYLPESNKWSMPFNLGYPVNSSGNDTHFRLTDDALAAVMSSDRKENNLGKRDIYLVYFKEALEEQMFASQGSPLFILIHPENRTGGKNEVQTILQTKPESRNRFSVEPIFYQDDSFLKEGKNQKIAANLVAILKAYPELTLHISGHAYEESLDPVNLYFSVKKAEQLSEYLQEQGINPERLHCYGLGASLPMAKTIVNESESPAAQKLNKRLDVRIGNVDTSKIFIDYKSIPVHALLQPELKSNSFTNPKSLHYALYLGDAASLNNHPLVDDSKGFVFVEKNTRANVYHYFFGNYQNFEKASTALKNYRAQGISIHGIKARFHDSWLERKELIDHVLEFPDLLLYLNYLKETEAEDR